MNAAAFLPYFRERGKGVASAVLLMLALASNAHAASFATEAALLTPAVQALCAATAVEPALSQARQRWVAALSAWERVSTVALGPVLERRSQRQIDFSPTRPHLIDKAVRSAPKTLADLERIGTPAKGLPALEWLLWTQPVQPGGTDCSYAVLVAQEIAREALALAGLPAGPATPNDLVNQWVGGLERLRWAQMELPLRAARTGGKAAPDYPRRASGASAIAWAAQWAALREHAVGAESLAAALSTRGQSPDALRAAVARADAAMNGLQAEDGDRVLAAARKLSALKRLVEDQIATALGVVIGFSDADGD